MIYEFVFPMNHVEVRKYVFHFFALASVANVAWRMLFCFVFLQFGVGISWKGSGLARIIYLAEVVHEKNVVCR